MSPETGIDLTSEERKKVVTLEKGSLQRLLGIPSLFAIGYGDVGSSIYYALGVTTLYALGAAPLALALAGIVFFCTVLTYSEMAAAMPESGGSCSYARRAFNDLVSFIAGWALLLDYIVTIAISAYSIGPYLSHFFPILKSSIGNIPFALIMIGILLSLNLVGIRESARISLGLCLFDILTQLSVIFIGAITILNLPYLWEHMRIGVAEVDWSPTLPQFMKGVGMAMVAYIGIESIAQLAGETKNPGRNVPRSMMLTMITLFVMYFGVSLVALSAIHPKTLSTTYLEDPIAGIAAALPIGGQILGPWVAILGATILFVAANAGLVGASRLTFAMGETFQLPRIFYRLHHRFKTPYVSLITFAVLSSLIILVAQKLTFIAELYNFGAMLAFSLAHLSMLSLRIREPEMNRPYKVRGNIRISKYEIPVTAVIGFLGTLAVWIDVIFTKPAGRDLGFLWMALGITAYLSYRRKKHLPASERLEFEKIVMPEYQHVPIKKIIVPTLGGISTETVQHAAKIALQHDAHLTALYVIEIPTTLPLDTFFPEKLASADNALERAQAIASEFGLVNVETHVLQSREAGAAIVEAAREGQYDLIVMGVRSQKGKTTTTLGRTVDHVVKNAPCRVWLCMN
ncbi:MAG: universal stress protein [Deltaproteobacteria bacterium]|nr:universal stress protein [Deltaproteobacteria bacterium]